MTTTKITVEATLQPDGRTLQLAKKLALPPGPVTITVQSPASKNGPSMMEVLDRIHQDQQQRGRKPMTEEEMAAEISLIRSEDSEYEERWQNIWSQIGEEPEEDGQNLMLVYLDSVICIYAVEGAASFQARARLASMKVASDQPAISDLTWLECRVKPIRLRDAVSLADMEAFLTGTDVVRLPMDTAVYERACRIRAIHNYKLGDALHLAAVVESGGGIFLTNNHRLSNFPDIPVEVLS